MGRIKNQNVRLRLDQRLGPFQHIGGDADGGRTEQAPSLIAGGVGISDRLFDILDGDEALELIIVINDRQLFNFVFREDLLRLLKGGADRCGNQMVLGHDLPDRNVKVGQKAQIAVGDDADQPHASVADRHTGNLIPAHQRVGVGHIVIGRKVEWIDDDPVFRTLDLVHLGHLFLDGHIFVDDPDSPFAGNGYRHRRGGHSIHRGGDQRGVEDNVPGQHSMQVNIPGGYLRIGGDQQHVVEGESFADELGRIVDVKHPISPFMPVGLSYRKIFFPFYHPWSSVARALRENSAEKQAEFPILPLTRKQLSSRPRRRLIVSPRRA